MSHSNESEVAVRPTADPDAFPLVDADGTAQIRRVGTDSVVEIAAGDLRDDVERVSGRRPSLESGLPDSGERAVVVGTYGADGELDRAVDGRVPDHGLETHRERYVVATVDGADLGVERALVIVGSDPRGTAYGAYELSERIGVSPWYWWADVPPERREEIHLSPGIDVEGPPSVSYRGIFLNDEDFGLRPWATETHEPESPDGIGPRTYERVFELLLRLKGNTIWPAMHGGGKAFYQVEGNREAADRYGIFVGTSHCEPMHRNNVEEWDSDERGEWNYATNGEAIREYWAERLEEVCETENIFTIGMRGIHDSGMPGGETVEETAALLQRVIDDQRDMLADIVDPDVEGIPQVFCPYKEALELYRSGLDVPDDVCIVWPNDSFGYVRRLPSSEERERSGGHGIYYHLSYWGRPHDHQWLCSTPPSLIREELRRAYERGARELWIANVGDLKPAEKETEFFFDLAWDVDSVPDRATDWLERWARREFGPDRAAEIADVLATYYRLGLARKPEHAGWNSVYPNTAQGEPQFSAVAEGDEARRRLEAYAEIDRRAGEIHDALPEDRRTAFFHLVLYPVRCAHLQNRVVLDAMRSRLYAGQGRASADGYADSALEAHDRIRAETERYNESADGKWRGMMSAQPRDLPVFDAPSVARLDCGADDRPALGVAVEGEAGVAGTASGVADPETRFALPELVAGVDRRRFVDVFNRGGGALEWTATAAEDWLAVSDEGGVLEPTDGEREHRLWVSVDPAAAPDVPATGELRIEGAGRTVRVDVPVRGRAADAEGNVDADGRPDFAAVDGRVAVEAEHPSRVTDGTSPLAWEPVDGLSRTTDATMAVRPFDGPRLGIDTAPEALDERAPKLEYEFDWPGGEATVEAQFRPTHAPDDVPLRYAVAVEREIPKESRSGGGEPADCETPEKSRSGGGETVDDEAPTVVEFGADGDEHDPDWQRNVLRGTATARTVHDLEPGRHTLAIYGIDPGTVLDRIVVRAGDGPRSYLGPRETRVGAADPDGDRESGGR